MPSRSYSQFWSAMARSPLAMIVAFGGLALVAALVATGTFQRGTNVVDPSLTPAAAAGQIASDQGSLASQRATDFGRDQQAPAPLAANALFVDATNGDDANPGTEAAPMRTPTKAFQKSSPGMTVYFRGGVYDEAVLGENVIRQGGTPDEWLTIRPYPGEEVEIVAGGEYGDGFEIRNASYIEIRDFTIVGREDSQHGNGVTGNELSHDIRVLNNRISGFGQSGVSFVASSRITIEGNEIRDTAARSFWQGSGISLFEAEGPIVPMEQGYSNIVRSNYLVGNYNGVPSRRGVLTDGNCIIIDFFNVETTPDYLGSTLVENNVCVENGGRGVHVFNSSNVMVRNNTLIGNGRSKGLDGAPAEMVAVRADNVEFHNNLVLNNPAIRSHIAKDATNIVFENNHVLYGPPSSESNRTLEENTPHLMSRSGSDPVEAFAPLPGSTLIAAADPANQSADDLLGRKRPARGSVGALEAIPSS